MKALAWIFSRSRAVNFNTAIERQKLARTMPGQTGALASLRLTGCGL